MPAFNRVTLIGNLTRDPESRQLKGHNDSVLTITDFGLAVNRRFKTSGGDDREETLFIDCSAFGKTAETIANWARKGRLLLVEGRLKYESWEDRSGASRNKITVVVENFQFLGSRGEEEAEAGRPVATGRQQMLSSEFKGETKGRRRNAPPLRRLPDLDDADHASDGSRAAKEHGAAVDTADIPF